MNTTGAERPAKTYRFTVPTPAPAARDLVSGRTLDLSGPVEVPPLSTVVLRLDTPTGP